VIDWAAAYEAPISLDAARLLGTRARRPTLWTLAAFLVSTPLIVVALALLVPQISRYFLPWVQPVSVAGAALAVLWLFVCHAFASDWGGRTLEYRLAKRWRSLRLPRVLRAEHLDKHHGRLVTREHAIVTDYPRCVVEVQTINLRKSDAETLRERIDKLHHFLVGLRFPIQIVVRAWAGEVVTRRRFIAISADTEAILDQRAKAVIDGLTRAGLGGRRLNGDLFDSLQACWSPRRQAGTLGPVEIARSRGYVCVDGVELARGFVLAYFPKTIEANWLEGVLDGDLAADFCAWLDPLDNADEAQYLSDRINEWETAQHLNVGLVGSYGKLGYRDPDLDDSIKDAGRVKAHLRARRLRVFRGTIGFVVRGATVDELQERETQLRDQLREQCGAEALIPLDDEHDLAPLMATPTGAMPISYPLQIVSPALALTYPFSNSSITMPGGVECGVSLDSRRANTINLFAMATPHMLVPGTTNSGKGYFVKCLVWRLLHSAGWPDAFRFWIIQSEKDEYTGLAEAAGERGEVVKITSLEQIEGLLYPQSFAAAGGFRTMAHLTVFDLLSLPASLKGKAIARLLAAVEATAAFGGRPGRGFLVLDELGIVLENEDAALAIETAFRRFRSIPHRANPKVISRICCIGMTQMPSDLLTRPRGKTLTKLSGTHVYLKQLPPELAETKNVLHLSPDEVTFLRNADQGEALLVANGSRVTLRMEATDEERRFAET